jgi:hypothetical protein
MELICEALGHSSIEVAMILRAHLHVTQQRDFTMYLEA